MKISEMKELIKGFSKDELIKFSRRIEDEFEERGIDCYERDTYMEN